MSYHDFAKAPLLSPARERELLLRAVPPHCDVAARQELCHHNIRLVISIAKRYVRGDFSFEDAIGAGVIGIYDAMDRFDLSTGHRFSTYASHWIRSRIQQAADVDNRTMRTPLHAALLVRRMNRIAEEIAARELREPSIEELAEAAGVSIDLARKAMMAVEGIVSLETPMIAEGDTIGEVQPDTSPGPEELTLAPVEHEERRAAVVAMVETLAEDERQVIELYYGLDGEAHLNLNEIADLLQVKRSVIYKAHKAALAKMRVAAGRAP